MPAWRNALTTGSTLLFCAALSARAACARVDSVPPMSNSLTRALAAARFFPSTSARSSSLSICWSRYHPKSHATSPDPVGGAVVLFDQALAEQRSQRRIRPVRVLFEDGAFHGFPRDLSPADER